MSLAHRKVMRETAGVEQDPMTCPDLLLAIGTHDTDAGDATAGRDWLMAP